MLNWRCPKNPKSGGAEYVTRKHLEAWALAGHEIHWLAGSAKGLPQYEQLKISEVTRKQCLLVIPDYDPGSMQPVIHIHRYGSPITVYFLAPLLYFFKWHGDFDVVVDQIHGIPFLTPLWAWKSRKIAFIHEVAQEIWDEMLPFPINVIGKMYEKVYFWFYKKIPFWTVSNSTKNDLIEYGIEDKYIHVIPNAIDLKPVDRVPEKEKDLTLLFVGRLVKMKGVEDAINIFASVKKDHPEAILWIVGSGEEKYVNHLKDMVKSRNLENSAIFKGYVSEDEKVRCYQRAHYLLHTSVREGFGLTVLEANSQGTPIIAYLSPGLKELVVNNLNGFLISPGLANINLTKLSGSSDAIYISQCRQSIALSKQFLWHISLGQSLKLVLTI